MEFKELTVEELTRGYVKDEESGAWICIFCGETFEEGLIYDVRGRLVNAERAMKEHILDSHGGVFYGLTGLDKQIHGLSDSQKDILEGMYLEKDNREMGQEMGISPATVRTHKFNLQRMKREAKILLAVLEQIENEEIAAERKRMELPDGSRGVAPNVEKTPGDAPKLNRSFTGNSLHPFFTQFNLK